YGLCSRQCKAAACAAASARLVPVRPPARGCGATAACGTAGMRGCRLCGLCCMRLPQHEAVA
ncbi:hypothetical protein BHE74_00045661, partial [Ensete ventricosum]